MRDILTCMCVVLSKNAILNQSFMRHQYSSFTFKLCLDSKFSGEDRITLGYNSGTCHTGDLVTIITWLVQQSIAPYCYFIGWTLHEVVDLSFILNEKYVSLYRQSDMLRFGEAHRNWDQLREQQSQAYISCINFVQFIDGKDEQNHLPYLNC